MCTQENIPDFVFETKAEPSNMRACTPAKTNHNKGDDELGISQRSHQKSSKKHDFSTDEDDDILRNKMSGVEDDVNYINDLGGNSTNSNNSYNIDEHNNYMNINGTNEHNLNDISFDNGPSEQFTNR